MSMECDPLKYQAFLAMKREFHHHIQSFMRAAA